MLGYLAFYKSGNKIPHSSPLELHITDRISIMFEMQKNGQKFNTIMQWQTGHTHLCPIIQWAALTQQILGYPGTTKNTKVLTVQNSRKLLHITSKIITMALHDGVAAYGKAKLQIFKHKVGTHFIQLRHSHGNVPWGGTRIHNHANP